MSLSDERVFYPEGFFYPDKDVKEFIRELKERRSCKNKECICCNENFAVLEKSAGEKLVK